MLREGNREAFTARMNTMDPDHLNKPANIQAPALCSSIEEQSAGCNTASKQWTLASSKLF